MTIQQTIVQVANQAFAQQNREATVLTEDLLKLIQDGEKQLEGLHMRIKKDEREIMVLKDRVSGQRDTINNLKRQLAESNSKKGK